MKKILVAVDESEGSKNAFGYSLDEAKELGNDLTILRVVSSFGYAGDVLEDALEDELKNAREFVKDLKEKAKEKDVDVDTEVITGTDIPSEIVKYAGENDYDLIVVGSGGKTDLEAVTLGSVSEGVVKKAPCPVLVVR